MRLSKEPLGISRRSRKNIGRVRSSSAWPLFRPLTAREWITQYQVVQRDIGRFVARFVSDRDLAPPDEAEISNHFKTITGAPVTIAFERLEQIARAPSGKFMMAMSEIAARVG